MIVPFVSFISKEFERVNFEFSRHVREISSSEYRKFLNIGKGINQKERKRNDVESLESSD